MIENEFQRYRHIYRWTGRNFNNKKHLTSTRFYYHDKLTWCVQKSKLIPVWKNILHVCRDPLVYILMSSITIGTLFLAYVAEQLEPHHHRKWDWNKCWCNALCCYFGFPCAYNPVNNTCRVGYTLVLYGGIIFVTVINTGLIRILLINIYNPQVQTVQDIIDGQYTLVGDQVALNRIMQQNEVKFCARWIQFQIHKIDLSFLNIDLST